MIREGDRRNSGNDSGNDREERLPCDLDDSEAKAIFSKIDTNHNGIAGWDEIKAALEEKAKESGEQWSQEDKKWIEKTFNEDQNVSGSGLDENEFIRFANQVSNHFDFCGAKK